MLVANYTSLRNNLKDYCDQATDDNEIVLVTRKNDKNVVLMSLDRLNQLEKELRNAMYLAKVEKAFKQLDDGKGIEHELIEEE